MRTTFCFRWRVRPFVVLFVERSGSTYLATALDEHPQVLSKREEFAHLRQRGGDGAEQLQWARWFWTPPWLGAHRAIGFKSKLVDVLDPAGFKRTLQDLGVRVIRLQRRNLVKAVVSTINARRLHRASGNWNLLDESDRLSAFQVDCREFESLLQDRIRWDRELEKYVAGLRLPTLSLQYEELLTDETLFLQRVFDFIGVQPKPVQGKTLKNTRDDLRKVILNFDELRGRFAGTQYYSLFDEVVG